jgi:hypothetical protein
VSLAVAAIIISSVTLAWTVGWSVYTHRRATKPSVVLHAAWGYPVYDMPGGDTHTGQRTIHLTATNTGQATVTLSSCKVLIRGKPKTDSVSPMAWVVQSPGPLPIQLESGGHWTGMIDAESVEQALGHHYGERDVWQVRPVVTDTAGRLYETKRERGWRHPIGIRWMKL